MAIQYWLMKSEPDVFSIDNLIRDKKSWWTGVRNYQARNFMMNDMKVGDLVLFYHSSADPSGVAGIAKVSRLAEADSTQFDKKSDSYEPKASLEKPMWFCVEVAPVKKFKNFVPLEDLKKEKSLASMQVLKKGQRLSIQPVTEKEFHLVEKMGG